MNLKQSNVKTNTWQSNSLLFAMVLAIFLMGMNLSAGEKQVINKNFSAKKNVSIATVSGDCKIEVGNSSKITVKVEHNYDSDRFKAIFEEEGDKLVIKEKFKNKKWNDSMRNRYSKWTVTVPANTTMSFASASGDLKVSGIKNSLNVKTASGDVIARAIKGNFQFKTASGDVKLENASSDVTGKTASGDMKFSGVSGAFILHTASGDIKANAIVFTGKSSFRSVSGEVDVQLAKTSKYDLDFTTVSGDLDVDYNGNAVKGYFKFKGQKGNISSAIPFDHDDSSKYGPFAKKSFTKGSDSPRVNFKTVSGDISFKK